MTCSALKRVYRDKLRMPGVVFVYMDGNYDTVQKRLSARQGHFMKADEQEADAIIAALGLQD